MPKSADHPTKLTESDSWHILDGQIKEYHHIQQLAHSTAKGAFSVIVGFTSIVVVFFAYFDIDAWQTADSVVEIANRLPILGEFTGDMIIAGIIQSTFLFMVSILLLMIGILKIIDVLSQEALLPISQVDKQQEIALERTTHLGSPPNYAKWIKCNRENIKQTKAKFRASLKILIISSVLMLFSLSFLFSSISGRALNLLAFTIFVSVALSGFIYSVALQIIYSIIQKIGKVSKMHNYTMIGLNIIRINEWRRKYSEYTSPISLFLFVYVLITLSVLPSIFIMSYWIYQEYLYMTLIALGFLILLGISLFYIYLEVLGNSDNIPFDYKEESA